MTTVLRVLVCDDSPTVRALISDVLAGDPDIRVVGQAQNGLEAVRLAAKLRPDVITMDIEMPLMDGLEATRQIMVQTPTPIVIVTARDDSRETSLSLDATEAGALCVAGKPPSPLAAEFSEQCRQLVGTVRAMAQVKVVRRWRATGDARPVLDDDRGPEPTRRLRIVAIAASTGGPAALHSILRRLPAAFPAPLVVVQHIASGFTGAFADWLRTGCSLRVKLASDGELLTRGTVYIAPENRHLGVGKNGRVLLSEGPPIGGFRPAATYLFDTVAREYGPAAAAVILTGMGSDGVAGLKRVRASGGCVFVQDEETSVVFGMPREAIAAGVATAVLTPAGIAERLKHHVHGDTDG